jgi:hypothetical protein
VNYNRHEPKEPRSAGSGIVDEKPIPAAGIEVDLRLPPSARASAVLAMTPENPEPMELRFEAVEGRVRFVMPELMVYGVARVRLDEAKQR